MEIGWLTAFVDRPAGSSEVAERFWAAVTGSTMSSRRGTDEAFATFVPPDGDPYLRVQRLRSGDGGCHLDLHVPDVAGAVAFATECGADRLANPSGVATMRSPGGMTFCLVEDHWERDFPAVIDTDGATFAVDQVCIDVPANRWVVERRFWERLTGWSLAHSASHPELGWLVPHRWTQQRGLRLLLQRTRDRGTLCAAHLDLAANDRSRVVQHLRSLGAEEVARFDHWTVMRDPTGHEFCVTDRDPATGVSTTRPRWATTDDLVAAWGRFAGVFPRYESPAAYTVCRQDGPQVSFGHLNGPGGEHLLPAAVLSVVCEHGHGSATCELGTADLREAIRLLEPAEAATHVEHPNLWSWRTLLDEAHDDSRFLAVFVADLHDQPSSPLDALFRTELRP